MSDVWDRFDTIAKPEEVEEAKAQMINPDAGDYLALLEEIKPDENKDGLPMVKSRWRLVEGNKVVFFNQNLQNLNYPNMTAVNIANAVAYVSTILGEEVVYQGMSKFAAKIGEIAAGQMYKINVSYGKKDLDCAFPKIKVIEKVDDSAPFDV